MKEGIDGEEENRDDSEGLDGGGNCLMAEMTESTTLHVNLKDSESCM
jgi:hypothetical protein